MVSKRAVFMTQLAEQSLSEILFIFNFLSFLERVTFKVKTAVATFWESFGENWATFYSAGQTSVR